MSKRTHQVISSTTKNAIMILRTAEGIIWWYFWKKLHISNNASSPVTRKCAVMCERVKKEVTIFSFQKGSKKLYTVLTTRVVSRWCCCDEMERVKEVSRDDTDERWEQWYWWMEIWTTKHCYQARVSAWNETIWIRYTVPRLHSEYCSSRQS